MKKKTQLIHNNLNGSPRGSFAAVGSQPHHMSLSPQDWDPVEVIREFVPTIRRIAAAFASRNPSALDVEDLTSAGIIGLLGAMKRYDPERETKFRTFAEYRIRGMMLDEIRSMDWVPRSVRSKIDQIRQVTADFVKREGRPPERKEIADILGISQEELEESATKNGRLLSLDEPMGNDEESFTLKDVVPDTDHPDPFTACLTAETQQALMSAIGLLSNRQQEVINLYYFKGLTMKEIGRQLGLTESGICRIHGLAVQRLRLEIEERQKVGSKKGLARPLDVGHEVTSSPVP